MQQFYRSGGQNQQSTQHKNQVRVEIHKSSGGNDINVVIVVALVRHHTVGLGIYCQQNGNKKPPQQEVLMPFFIGKSDGVFHLYIYLSNHENLLFHYLICILLLHFRIFQDEHGLHNPHQHALSIKWT